MSDAEQAEKGREDRQGQESVPAARQGPPGGRDETRAAPPAVAPGGETEAPRIGGAGPDGPRDERAPASERPAADLDAADVSVERLIRRQSRRSFLVAGLSALAGVAGWRWLATRREDGGIPWPLRRALEINENLARDYFRPSRLAPTFPRSMAREPRVNGTQGLEDADFDQAAWTLRVEGLAEPAAFTAAAQGDGEEGAVSLTLGAIKALSRVDVVTELRCIEGWSEVVHWTGARFADFVAAYPPLTRSGNPPDPRRRPDDLCEYVSLETPDAEYYVGLDMASAMHPQALLCYEMNGAPLSLDHGAPLRLVMPVKYGIKSIKRIGKIRFTNTRPRDYWAERGYDWYAGH